MPWKECHVVEERLRFIARLLDGEKMAGLCREFGISRKTGYKIYDRYQDCGLDGLTDRSCGAPRRHTMPSAQAVGKRAGGARRTSVSQSSSLTGHFVRLHLRPRCRGRGDNRRIH